jgi:hypothetical protein
MEDEKVCIENESIDTAEIDIKGTIFTCPAVIVLSLLAVEYVEQPHNSHYLLPS